MFKYCLLLIPFLWLFSCKNKQEKIKPHQQNISESVYASGYLKSKNQYQVFATVNGIVEHVFVEEGDTVAAGSVLLTINNTTQHINKENAALAASFNDEKVNEGKLTDARQLAELAQNKLKLDSSLYFRQKNLWADKIGSKLELEQKELAYQNSRSAYFSALQKYKDLQRQIALNDLQTKNNLKISDHLESDYTVKSEIKGIVYSINKSKGELVSPQTPLALIGDAKEFMLEMQVDENDIIKINKGLTVLVNLDTYKDKVFEARIARIKPLLNEKNKTFLVEAEFVNPPEKMYPNISFEANIVLQTKKDALLIPVNYLVNTNRVIKSTGDTVVVEVGLRDYQFVEILSGLKMDDELLKPSK